MEQVPDGGVMVTATDACGGISKDDLERVIDTARPACPNSRPGRRRGLGLGLAIVRGVVEAHRGSVGVVNIHGSCRFEVRLPH
ncbi:ATP-binding protein [Streptodolium elevatio]